MKYNYINLMLRNIFSNIIANKTHNSIKYIRKNITKYSKINIRSELVKKYISSTMETTNSRLVNQKDEQELKSLLEGLNIQEKNLPDVPSKSVRVTSFGGRIRIAALFENHEKWIGKIITLGGWVKTLRLQGGGSLAFVELNDGSSNKGIQLVVDKNLNNFEIVVKEGIGSCFQIRGSVVPSLGKKQAVNTYILIIFQIEIQIIDNEQHFVKVLGSCDQGEYPLIKSKDKMKLETLREICHLRPRSNIISTVARIRNSLAYATHLFFQTRGFQYVHTPIITGSDCEGAGEMFQVTTILPKPHEKGTVPTTKEGLVDYKFDFFGKPTFLTVSGQLAVENYACALSDVYTFGPTFRAENSNTSRHLAEFWMIEPEMCFADIHDDMECAENYLKFCLKFVLENNNEDMQYLDAQVEKGIIERLKNVTENNFFRVPYTEAIEILKKVRYCDLFNHLQAVENDKNLFKEEKKKEKKDKKKEKKDAKDAKDAKEATNQTAGESSLKVEAEVKPVVKEPEKKKEDDKRNIYWGMDMASEHERFLTENHFKMPIIVYNYPKEIKSFYMKLNPDGKTVAAMDILVPKIGEIVGGSQREEKLDLLEKRLEELKMDKKDYWWYLELRKYGSVPHSGFGLGFERLVMMATGVENIRDVIPYPRYPGHSEF